MNPYALYLVIAVLFTVAYYLVRTAKKKKIEQAKAEWYEINSPLGRSLGYPECCIAAFCAQPPSVIDRYGVGDEGIERYKAGCIDEDFTGFIPCIEHARQINNGKITLESLVQNRKEEFLEFPLYAKY